MRSTFPRPSWLPQVFPGKTHMDRHRARAITAFAAILLFALVLEWTLVMALIAAALLADDLLDGPDQD